MNKTTFFLFKLVLSLVFFTSLSFSQLVDNFEYYFVNQQLACQSQNYWTTWSSLPCDPVEDPYLSSNFSHSGTKSVKIVQNNDLVNTLDSIGLPGYYLNFWIYIPSGKDGYFNLLSGYTPNPFQWGMECYFDVGGTGRLIHGLTQTFSWTPGTWHFVSVIIELYNDTAEFWFDGVQVSTWQWSQGGIINLQVDAIDFFGATANNEMYVDDFVFWDGCLSCTAPFSPGNLIAQEIFDPGPKIKLNWQDNSFIEYLFHIVRKDGYPNDPGSFEFIGTTSANVTEFIDSLVIVDQRYSYGSVAHGGYGYSDTSNFTTILVEVPVELVSFSYEITAQNNVTLSWITATETNNQGFEILCKNVEEIEWNTIAFVNGHGTTTESQFYSYNDKSLQTGKYQYRLKQIDFDGSFEYSKVLDVTIQVLTEFSLSQNYPNPFNPSTKIKFTIPNLDTRHASSLQMVTLKVFNVLGNEIATLVNEEKPADEYEITFDASELPTGIYFYKLSAGEYNQTRKMILLK